MSLSPELMKECLDDTVKKWILDKENLLERIKDVISEIQSEERKADDILWSLLYYRDRIEPEENYLAPVLVILSDGIREEFKRNLEILKCIANDLLFYKNFSKKTEHDLTRHYEEANKIVKAVLKARILPVLEMIVETGDMSLNYRKRIQAKRMIEKRSKELLEKIKDEKRKLENKGGRKDNGNNGVDRFTIQYE